MNEKTLKKCTAALVLILIAAISFFFLANWAGSSQTNLATIESIDNKTATVLKLTATASLASVGISAIPGDTATPIADKLTDFAEYFLLILCILYAEKYLLTLIGAAAFKVLIPIACGLGIVAIFSKSYLARRLATRLAIFSVAMFLIIPLSIRGSDMIYKSYEDSINATITETEQFTDETAPLTEESNQSKLASLLESLKQTASGLTQKASGILNHYVQALAILIVTSCVIPILIIIFFIWLIKLFTGLSVSTRMLRPPVGPKHKESTELNKPLE